MFGRPAIIAALVLCVASCDSQVPGTPTTDSATATQPASGTAVDLLSTVPETDDQRWEILRRLRAIDSCALLPAATLETHGRVTEIGSHSTLPSSCRAVIDSDPAGPSTIDWDLQKGPLKGRSKPPVRSVGAVEITEELDEPAGDPASPLHCRLTAHFPSEALLYLDVEAAAPTDQCGLAHKLIDTAIAQIAEAPPHGTSPDSAATPITGADPCAAFTALGITPAAPEEQLIQMCVAGEGDDELVISYNYDEEAAVVGSDETKTIDGRTVYASKVQEFTTYGFIVGPEIAPGEDVLGPILPAVSVTGSDEATVERITRQLFTTLE